MLHMAAYVAADPHFTDLVFSLPRPKGILIKTPRQLLYDTFGNIDRIEMLSTLLPALSSPRVTSSCASSIQSSSFLPEVRVVWARFITLKHFLHFIESIIMSSAAYSLSKHSITADAAFFACCISRIWTIAQGRSYQVVFRATLSSSYCYHEISQFFLHFTLSQFSFLCFIVWYCSIHLLFILRFCVCHFFHTSLFAFLLIILFGQFCFESFIL